MNDCLDGIANACNGLRILLASADFSTERKICDVLKDSRLILDTIEMYVQRIREGNNDTQGTKP